MDPLRPYALHVMTFFYVHLYSNKYVTVTVSIVVCAQLHGLCISSLVPVLLLGVRTAPPETVAIL